MRSAPYPSSSNPRRELLGRRAGGILVVILVHLLAFIIGFILSPPLQGPRKPQRELKLFEIPPPTTSGTTAKLAQRSHKVQPKQVTERKTPKPLVPPPVLPVRPLNMMVVSSDVFAAADISRFPSQHAERPSNDAATTGNGNGSETGRLSYADWVHPPTPAELTPYLPAKLQEGWALITCRTIDHFQVDDCRELNEFPRNSGLAHGVSQAAWQFRIMPIRMNGTPMIGSRVKILYIVGKGVVSNPDALTCPAVAKHRLNLYGPTPRTAADIMDSRGWCSEKGSDE